MFLKCSVVNILITTQIIRIWINNYWNTKFSWLSRVSLDWAIRTNKGNVNIFSAVCVNYIEMLWKWCSKENRHLMKSLSRFTLVITRDNILKWLTAQIQGIKKELKWMKVQMKSLSRVRLFATPWTVPYQAPLSVGFSRQ